MSQNMFGTPTQEAVAEEVPTNLEPSSRRKLVLGVLGGVTAVVVAGAAALVLTGERDDVEPAVAAPAPAATAPPAPEATEEPAPLPTLVDSNGRNPFRSKIVPAAAAAGGGGSQTGGGSQQQEEVVVPAPVETVTITETVVVKPGDINVEYLGTDFVPKDNLGTYVPDPAMADFRFQGREVLLDVEKGEGFAFYFQLLEVTPDTVKVRFGDETRTLTKGKVSTF